MLVLCTAHQVGSEKRSVDRPHAAAKALTDLGAYDTDSPSTTLMAMVKLAIFPPDSTRGTAGKGTEPGVGRESGKAGLLRTEKKQ